jgi:tripartite-type tricarboxylate transporter receptor subunit TctC
MTLATPRRGLLAAGALLATPSIARAQAWPARPVTMVVGFPPGGQTDFAARVLQPGISGALSQPVVIDNRGGAGGNLGTEAVLRARPDGYTLLAGNANPIVINPHTMPSMTFNPLQLTPIGMMLQSGMVLCVHPSVPARNVAEFVAWARQQPRGVDYGSASAGSLSHVTMELFRGRVGLTNLEHVPYRGSGPAMQDFIANRFSAMFDAASVVAPFVQANQLRPILVTTAQRIPAYPEVPTAREQGIADFVVTAWIALFGPPGLPAEVVTRANAALNAAARDPATRERITSRGDEPGGGSAEAVGELMRREHAMWGEVVRANNIRAE